MIPFAVCNVTQRVQAYSSIGEDVFMSDPEPKLWETFQTLALAYYLELTKCIHKI